MLNIPENPRGETLPFDFEKKICDHIDQKKSEFEAYANNYSREKKGKYDAMMSKLIKELEHCIKNKINFSMKIGKVNRYIRNDPLSDWISGNRSMDAFEHGAIEDFIHLVRSKHYNCSYELCYDTSYSGWDGGFVKCCMERA